MDENKVWDVLTGIARTRAQWEAGRPPGHRPDYVTCGECNRTWDDAHVTHLTPAPAARCPFEHEHAPAEQAPAEQTSAPAELERVPYHRIEQTAKVYLTLDECGEWYVDAVNGGPGGGGNEGQSLDGSEDGAYNDACNTDDDATEDHDDDECESARQDAPMPPTLDELFVMIADRLGAKIVTADAAAAQSYSLQEIRRGTGFARGARFIMLGE